MVACALPSHSSGTTLAVYSGLNEPEAASFKAVARLMGWALEANSNLYYFAETMRLHRNLAATQGPRDLRKLEVQSKTSFYIEHFSRSSSGEGELDSDVHSSEDDCRELDYQEWNGTAEEQSFGNYTMGLDGVELEPRTEPLLGTEQDSAQIAVELRDNPEYGVPLYQLKDHLAHGLPAHVVTFFCASCKYNKSVHFKPELGKKKTKKGGMSNPKGTTCTDCLQKRREKYHASKEANILKRSGSQPGSVSPTQPQSEATRVVKPTTEDVKGLTVPMEVDNNFKVLTTPRMVNAGFEETIHCTSCKKEKLVGPNRPDCVTCSNCRNRRQKDYTTLGRLKQQPS